MLLKIFFIFHIFRPIISNHSFHSVLVMFMFLKVFFLLLYIFLILNKPLQIYNELFLICNFLIYEKLYEVYCPSYDNQKEVFYYLRYLTQLVVSHIKIQRFKINNFIDFPKLINIMKILINYLPLFKLKYCYIRKIRYFFKLFNFT